MMFIICCCFFVSYIIAGTRAHKYEKALKIIANGEPSSSASARDIARKTLE